MPRKKLKQRGGGIPTVPPVSANDPDVAIAKKGGNIPTAAQASKLDVLKDSKMMQAFLKAPHNWFLMMWVFLYLFKLGGVGIPLWILYICAIPFCIAVLLYHFNQYKINRKVREGKTLDQVGSYIWNAGFKAMSHASPPFFLIIQLIVLIYLYKAKDDIIENSSKIPENFGWFQYLINGFLFGQVILILHYIRNPKDIENLGLWFVMSVAITGSVACIHYIWLILTKLITDG